MRKQILSILLLCLFIFSMAPIVIANGVELSNNNTVLTKCPSTMSGTYVVPSSVKVIGQTAFLDCKLLTNIVLHDGIEQIKPGAFSGCSALESIQLPKNLKEIDDSVFVNCSSLKTVFIPDSVTEIGVRAFCNCTSLEEISIPKNVTIVNTEAFGGCTNLKKVNNQGRWDGIYHGVFAGCEELTEFEIPTSATFINTYAFKNCSKLVSLEIPNSITAIGAYAFEYCGIQELVIPDSVKEIGAYAFKNCGNLETVVIPNGISRLENGTFEYCRNVKRVLVPTNLKQIAYGDEFNQCNNLTDVYYLGSEEEWYQIENIEAVYDFRKKGVTRHYLYQAEISETATVTNNHDGTYTFMVPVSNTVQGASLITVVKKGDMVMGVTTTKIDVGDSQQSITVEATEAEYAQIFMWDGATLTPVCNMLQSEI